MWAASRSVSYDLPTVSSMLFGRIATTGSSNIYVSGHGYSVSQMSQAIRFGHSDVLALNWASDSAIYGKIRQGSGASLTLRISISSQFSIQQINVSYSAPILSSFAGVNGPSSGQFMIDVFGLNFGAIRTSPQAQLGNTGCIFAEWKSDSLARCKVSQGFSRAIGFKLTIDSQSNSQTNVFTFDSPIMNSVSLKNGPTTGNFMIEVFGSKFGPADTTPKILFGPSRFEQTITYFSQWTSDTSIQSKVRPGFGISMGFFLSVDLTQSDILDVFSFDSPVLSSADRTLGHTTGAHILSLYGLQFGTFESKLQFKISSTASRFTQWISDTRSFCRIEQGTSRSLGIYVSVAKNVKSLSLAFSYLSSVVSELAKSNGPASGASVILVSGSQFALGSYSPKMRLSTTACEISQWISDSSLHSKSSAGFLSAKSVVVTVVSGSSELSKTFTFDSIASGLSVPSNAPTSVAVSLSIIGSGFGNGNPCSSVGLGSFSDNFSSCESSMWVSSSVIVCKSVSGSGGQVGAVIFQSDDRFSFVSSVISYDGPSVSSIELGVLPASGSTIVTVLGASLALSSRSLAVSLDRSGCSLSHWVSDSAVRCKAPSGKASNSTVLISSGNFYGSSTRILSYSVPKLSSIGQTNAPGTGAVSVSLYGSSFGSTSPSSRVSLGRTVCEATTWWSDSASSYKVCSGVGSGQSIDVDFNSATVSGLFSYNAPTIQSNRSVGLNAPTSGSVSVTVIGAGFGLVGYTSRSNVGRTAFSTTNWVSQSCVLSKSVLGSASSISAMVSVVLLRGSSTNVLTYNTVVVSNAMPTSSPGTGSVCITMFGKSIGLYPGNVLSRVGFSMTILTVWRSDSVAFSKVDKGSYASLPLYVSFQYGTNQLSQTFSFEAPVGVSVYQANSPSSGNVQITVLAKNAGVSSLVARAVSVGVTTCVSTTWISGSSIVCRTSEGVGSLIPVVVSVGLQRGVSNNVVSYDSLIISSFLPSNRPTTSAVSITVVGRGMGTFDSSPAASVNDVMSPFTKWIADSNIISKAPYANGISLNVKLSVQSLQGSLVNVNAFDSAVVSAVVPASGSSSGSISITVVGNGLQLVASSVSVRVGRSISPATAWISDSSVAGLIVSGFGGAIDVRASIWRQSGSSTRVWSYNSPTPLSMACNAPDSGAVYVTVVDLRDLGTNSWSSVLKLLGSVAECSRWVSECSLVSKTSAGSSRFAPVSVTVALQSSAPQMTLAVTFNAPALSSVRQTMVSSGSNSITVIGKGIGNADVTAMIRAGFSSCERSTWISASSVRCKGQSGSGRSFGIVASSATRAGSLSSAYLYAGYAAALVFFVSVSNSSTTGSVSITVFGGQYSSTDRSHCIRVSSASASLAALWISDSSVLGKVRPGVGLGNPIFVSHGIQASASWSKGFAFDAATLSTMTIANSPASGSASITCFGAGFGVSRFFSARMRLGFSNSAASSWFSDSGMPSKFPRGVGNILPGTVTVGVSRGSSSQLFT